MSYWQVASGWQNVDLTDIFLKGKRHASGAWSARGLL